MNFWFPLSVSLLLGVEVLRVKAFSGFPCFGKLFFSWNDSWQQVLNLLSPVFSLPLPLLSGCHGTFLPVLLPRTNGVTRPRGAGTGQGCRCGGKNVAPNTQGQRKSRLLRIASPRSRRAGPQAARGRVHEPP